MRPDEWLVTVLIRHHALPGTTIASLALDDINFDRATLTAAGHRRPLDQLTKDAITSYLAYRTRRWPLTANRHLLLSRLSALQDGPVSPWWISQRITRWKSTMTELRQDRILEEAAAATRDPMHIATMLRAAPQHRPALRRCRPRTPRPGAPDCRGTYRRPEGAQRPQYQPGIDLVRTAGP